MLMGVTDTIVAGRANTTDLAALAVGNAIYSPLWFALSGILFAVTPIPPPAIVKELYLPVNFFLFK